MPGPLENFNKFQPSPSAGQLLDRDMKISASMGRYLIKLPVDSTLPAHVACHAELSHGISRCLKLIHATARLCPHHKLLMARRKEALGQGRSWLP